MDSWPRLTPDEETFLLDLARRAIVCRLASAPSPDTGTAPPRLLLFQGAFVSLRHDRALRGCVGMVPPTRSLALTVCECAAAAATEDRRFGPIAHAELAAVSIEISVLDQPFRVTRPAEIIIGTHGVMVSLGKRRGLLLPQVALEHRWDVSTLLEQTCRKAGLAPDAWAHGAIVEAFSAQVFFERDRRSY